jgi:polyhydroxyalkanoate synthesis regulator phasin
MTPTKLVNGVRVPVSAELIASLKRAKKPVNKVKSRLDILEERVAALENKNAP